MTSRTTKAGSLFLDYSFEQSKLLREEQHHGEGGSPRRRRRESIRPSRLTAAPGPKKASALGYAPTAWKRQFHTKHTPRLHAKSRYMWRVWFHTKQKCHIFHPHAPVFGVRARPFKPNVACGNAICFQTQHATCAWSENAFTRHYDDVTCMTHSSNPSMSRYYFAAFEKGAK